MSGSKQYGKGFWSAAANTETIIDGIAKGFKADLNEWPPSVMEEIIIKGISKGIEIWLDDNKDVVVKNIKLFTIGENYE